MAKNHLYHTLSPLLLLASVILLILTYLSPVLIFSDTVSLLSVTMPVGSSTSSNATLTRRERRSAEQRDGQVHAVQARRMTRKVRRAEEHFAGEGRGLVARATNATSNSSAGSASSTVHLYFGPMGACHMSTPNTTLTCQSPSFTPIFDELLDSISSSSSTLATLTATLPSQFPLAPTALFLAFLALTAGFLVSLAHASAHHVTRFERLQAKASRMRRLMVGAVGSGWALGVVVTLCLFVELRRDVEAFGEVRVSGASAGLGKGFQMLVATWILSLLSLLLLGAETFTNRAH